jgi:hypothetical protein
MWRILRGEPEAVVAWAPVSICLGFAIVGLSIAFDSSGIITGFFLGGLGVTAAGLSGWRRERGLWMLATVLILMYGFCYVVSCFSQVMDAMRGAPANHPALVVDFSIGTLLLIATLRFLFNVARENYTFSNSDHGDC